LAAENQPIRKCGQSQRRQALGVTIPTVILLDFTNSAEVYG
jgi:hypothetical protein